MPLPQLVGQSCGRCQKWVAADYEARFCGTCGCPVHTTCAAPDAGGANDRCPACGCPIDHPTATQVRAELALRLPWEPPPPRPAGGRLRCPRCGSAKIKRRSGNGVTPHPGYDCYGCGQRMRPRGSGLLYGVLIALCVLIFLAGGVVPVVAGEGFSTWKWAWLSLVAIAYLVKQCLHPPPRMADALPDEDQQ